MKKTELQAIAEKEFKKDENLVEVFFTSDGFMFFHKNAADLHANTNVSGKKMEVITIKKEDFIVAAEPKPLSKMTKAELEAVAKEKGVDISNAPNNGERVKLIETVINSEIVA